MLLFASTTAAAADMEKILGRMDRIQPSYGGRRIACWLKNIYMSVHECVVFRFFAVIGASEAMAGVHVLLL